MEFTSRVNVAPEILINPSAGLSPSCDIWSLGIIIIQLFTGITSHIYEEMSHEMKDSEYKNVVIKNMQKKITPCILEKMDNSSLLIPLKAIVVGMLRFDCDERPDIFKVADVLNIYFRSQKMEKFIIKYEKNQKESFQNLFKKF